MTVYVDPIQGWGSSPTWPWSESCHMIADTEQELDDMAGKIGLLPRWKQPAKNASRPHYDLTASKRKMAIRRGAAEIGFHRFSELMFPRRVPE